MTKKNPSDRKKRTKHLPITLDAQNGSVIPTPRIKLHSMHAIRRELVKVYREMRTGKTLKEDGSKYAYVLMQISELVKLTDFQDRLEALEKGNGARAR